MSKIYDFSFYSFSQNYKIQGIRTIQSFAVSFFLKLVKSSFF